MERMSAPKHVLLCCLLGLAWSASFRGDSAVVAWSPHVVAWSPDHATVGDQDDKLPHANAIARFGTNRFRTADAILSLAYSPNGKILASGGRNDAVLLWDAESGALLRKLDEQWVWALAFSPDGKYLATGGANKIVRVWDAVTGKEVSQLQGHSKSVKSLAFSGDG